MKLIKAGSIKRLGLVLTMIALAYSAARAQAGGDACHVYLVDVKAAEKAYKSLPPNATAEAQTKALSSVMKILGEFNTTVREEELTTKTYPFPDSKLTVTASVFYTDESMPGDSVTLALAVSDKAESSALTVPNNAVSEVNYTESTRIVRVRKSLEINGRSYLLGLQCNHQGRAGAK